MTQRSALGGAVPSNLDVAQHRARMVIYPLGFCREFLDVCFFVLAFAMTSKLVGMILNEQRPDLVMALKEIMQRWRGILLFSLKYMLLNGAGAAVFILLTFSPSISNRISELAASKVILYALGLVWEGCLAWLLMPAAIRLLQAPNIVPVSRENRTLGTIFTILAAAVSLVLEFFVGRAEAGIIFENQWELTAATAMNSIVVNAPNVLLFIALALLAYGSIGNENIHSIPEVVLLPPESLSE
jgi:hypothetical protein